MQESQLYKKEWRHGAVFISMGSQHIFSFGRGCNTSKSELMRLGDIVLERLEEDCGPVWKGVEEWVKEECGEWAKENFEE